MTTLREAAQQALEAVQGLFDAEAHEGGPRSGHINTPATRDYWVRLAQARKALHESVSDLRTALAQEEQEPAIYPDEAREMGLEEVALYTHPPRREWQSLSEEEIRAAYGKDLKYRDGDYERFARAIEAALKEKNHG
jgi:hypothetical protein